MDLATIQLVLSILTLISIPVGVFYYLLTLRNQNRTRQIQIIRGLNPTEVDLDFLTYTYTSYDDFMAKYGPEADPESWMNIMKWFSKLEEFGVYVKEGLLDIRFLYLLHGGTIKKSWDLLQVLKDEYRARHNWSRWLIEAEWLCKQIIEYEQKHPELAT